MIYCKGVKDDTAIHMGFAYPADKVAHEEKFCETDFESCEIAQMLEKAGR